MQPHGCGEQLWSLLFTLTHLTSSIQGRWSNFQQGCWNQELCKSTAAFGGTPSTQAAGKFCEDHPSTICPSPRPRGQEGSALPSRGPAVLTGWQRQGDEGALLWVLLPPGYPPPWGLCFITRKGGGGGRKVRVHESQE